MFTFPSADMQLVNFRVNNLFPFPAFAVTPSGQIDTSMALDRENVSSYMLIVRVSDNGSPVLTTTATVVVTILGKFSSQLKMLFMQKVMIK